MVGEIGVHSVAPYTVVTMYNSKLGVRPPPRCSFDTCKWRIEGFSGSLGVPANTPTRRPELPTFNTPCQSVVLARFWVEHERKHHSPHSGDNNESASAKSSGVGCNPGVKFRIFSGPRRLMAPVRRHSNIDTYAVACCGLFCHRTRVPAPS